jgi:hypothetical protein
MRRGEQVGGSTGGLVVVLEVVVGHTMHDNREDTDIRLNLDYSDILQLI